MHERRARQPPDRGEKRKREGFSDSDDDKGHSLRRRASVHYAFDTSEDELADHPAAIHADSKSPRSKSLHVKLNLRGSGRRSLRLNGEVPPPKEEVETHFDLGAAEARQKIEAAQEPAADVDQELLVVEAADSIEASSPVVEEHEEDDYKEEEKDEDDDEDEEPIRRTSKSASLAGGKPLRLARTDSKSRPHRTNGESESEEYHGASTADDSELTPSEGPNEDVNPHSLDRRDLRDFVAPDTDDEQAPRRITRLRERRLRSRQGIMHDEIQELQDRAQSPPRRLRERASRVDYTIPPPPPLPSPRRKANMFAPRLFPTAGPFGGGGVPSLFGKNDPGLGAAGGADDSDSSDDERLGRAGPSATPGLVPATLNMDVTAGTPAHLGKLTKKQNLADADPLGVDMNINFDKVGGMDSHIQALKEMVSLPLLYPEIFQRFNVTPPRGVLFHGPPGTGKTLLARALAASCSSEGRKISFFMRKGADCLSKWVGEAERQLRLLFEEARNSQPSIIFFDEIDGLAPVRSSKQEQIHASIVSTLLALMDGMDGRGQVIVIGATNRPDAVDPALRRPGRFDREFYFPLPNTEARKTIIDIHTYGWDPPLADDFKLQLAKQTMGYGGADLRALCTEAALNAIQRRYPQIYQSTEKLLIEPKSINVEAKDFMISMQKIVPSSARSSSSGASQLPDALVPLLGHCLELIRTRLDQVFPRSKRLSAIEEAMYEADEGDFESEKMLQHFESARIFKPRLLIYGHPGSGQQYLAAAVLNLLEGVHVQTFDLSTIMGDSTRSPEAAVIQMFVEVKRHKPSIVFMPDVDSWFRTVADHVRETFLGLLRSITPAERVMLLAVADRPLGELHYDVKGLFSYSNRNRFGIPEPSVDNRREFFAGLFSLISRPPTSFPSTTSRKRRVLEDLPKAPPAPPKVLTKADHKAQERRDRQLKNQLKIRLGPAMDFLKRNYRKFRKPPIETDELHFLFDPQIVSHLDGQLPFVKTEDSMILVVATGQKYHNMDLDVMEERMWNGYYSTPKQFLKDLHLILVDAKTTGERERIVKAQEMYTNVQVQFEDAQSVADQQLLLEYERLYAREQLRQKENEIQAANQLVEKTETQDNNAGPAGHDEIVIIEKTGEADEDIEMRHEIIMTDGLEGKENLNGTNCTDEAMEEIARLTPSPSKSIEQSPTSMNGLHDSPNSPAKSKSPELESLEVTDVAADVEPTPMEIELDEKAVHDLHHDMVMATNDITVEQLEQIHSACMEVIWQRRGDWNRTGIISGVRAAFDETLSEINVMIKELEE